MSVAARARARLAALHAGAAPRALRLLSRDRRRRGRCRCARSRSSRSSSTTRPSRWPTCSGACGRSTGATIRAACTTRSSRRCISPRSARILALLMAVPIGFLAARNVTPNPAAEPVREVHLRDLALGELAGLGAAVRRGVRPGPLAGTLAIAFRSIGFTGKLLGEALEEANRGAIEALTAAGAPKLSTIVLGLLAAGAARLLVDRAVPLGHQHPRIGGARPCRRRRHRRGARYRAEPPLLGPGRASSLRPSSPSSS